MAEQHPGSTLHASCVAWKDKAVLITGASGAGKSGLALHLMALGCVLVSDDRTILHKRDDVLFATAPPSITGLVEARGVGLLNAGSMPEARVVLVVDLDTCETDRLPHHQTVEICGVSLPCLRKVDMPHFPAAIVQYLKAGRQEPS